MPGKKGEEIALTVFIILSLDQLSKFIATKNLLLNRPLSVVKGIFSLTLIHNRGAAFGLLKNQLPLFILTAIFAVMLVYFELRKNETPQTKVRGFWSGILERPYPIRALKGHGFWPRKYGAPPDSESGVPCGAESRLPRRYVGARWDKYNKAYRLALSLILAGALGNLIDRLFFGYVIDFLDFHIWPVFNIADSAITVGAIILGWSMLVVKKRKV